MNRAFSAAAIALQLERHASPLAREALLLLEEIRNRRDDVLPVLVVGSTDFEHDEGDAMRIACTQLGHMLRDNEHVTLLTGGMPGVGRAVAEAFHDRGSGDPPLWQVLPKNSGITPPAEGFVRNFGRNFIERQIVLGLSSRITIVIGGGPGATREANITLQECGVVLPIGCTGGAAAGTVFDLEDAMERTIDPELVRRRIVESGVMIPNHVQAILDPKGNPERAVRIIVAAIDKLAPMKS